MSREAQWGFDRTVTSKYGCKEMSYDPTVGKKTYKVAKNWWFFNIGLSGENGIVKNQQMKTLPTLLKDNKHTETTIDILKIDIECSEWSSFDAILANPSCLDNVKQLMVEFHPCRVNKGSRPPKELLHHYGIIRGIDQLGFKLWKIWNNYELVSGLHKHSLANFRN